MLFFKNRLSEDEQMLLEDQLGSRLQRIVVSNEGQDGNFATGNAVTLYFDDDRALRFVAHHAQTSKELLSCERILVQECSEESEGIAVLDHVWGKELLAVDVLEETQTGPERAEALMYDTTLLLQFSDGLVLVLSTYNQLPDQVVVCADPQEVLLFESEYIPRLHID